MGTGGPHHCHLQRRRLGGVDREFSARPPRSKDNEYERCCEQRNSGSARTMNAGKPRRTVPLAVQQRIHTTWKSIQTMLGHVSQYIQNKEQPSLSMAWPECVLEENARMLEICSNSYWPCKLLEPDATSSAGLPALKRQL